MEKENLIEVRGTQEKKRVDLDRIIQKLSEALSLDGGQIRLVDVDIPKGIVKVALSGACESCAISTVTLSQGVDRILKEKLPWITEVVGEVANELDFFESFQLGRGAYTPKIDNS